MSKLYLLMRGKVYDNDDPNCPEPNFGQEDFALLPEDMLPQWAKDYIAKNGVAH